MTASIITEDDRPADGVVQRLARDDLERKKFLKMAGRGMGAGVAATGLAAFIAACGSSSSSSSSPSSSASSSAAAAGTSSSTSEGSGDLAIVNYALTLEYLEAQFYSEVGKSGLFHGKTLSLLKSFGAAGGEHPEQGDPRCSARDPHDRGTSRRDAQHADQEVAHARRRLRQATRERGGAFAKPLTNAAVLKAAGPLIRK